MLLGHVLSFACPAGRNVLDCLRHSARRAGSAARAEITQGRLLVRRLGDELYDLVDRQARERYEGKRLPL